MNENNRNLGMHRYENADFSKGILIILMILCHLTYFTTKQPVFSSWVYSFHMSGFLVLSGWFTHVSNPIGKLRKTVKSILWPYVVFETIYLLGLGFLGKVLHSNNIFDLSFENLLNSIIFQPIGTYWYLHTLFICVSVVCLIQFLKEKIRYINTLVFSIIACFFLSKIINGLEWHNCMYFFIGFYGNQITDKIERFLMPSLMSLLLIVTITIYAPSFERNSLQGLALTFTMLSFLLAIPCTKERIPYKLFCYVGRNSLCVVVLSPIFMILPKYYIQLFKFDDSAVVYGIFSTCLVCSLCILCAYVLNKVGITKKVLGINLYSAW